MVMKKTILAAALLLAGFSAHASLTSATAGVTNARSTFYQADTDVALIQSGDLVCVQSQFTPGMVCVHLQAAMWNDDGGSGLGTVNLPPRHPRPGAALADASADRTQQDFATGAAYAHLKSLAAHPEQCQAAGLSAATCDQLSKRMASMSPRSCPPGTPIATCLKLIQVPVAFLIEQSIK